MQTESLGKVENYLNNLSNNTIYKNDYKLANSYDIVEWNPKETNEISGGVVSIIAPTGSGKSFLLKDILSQIYKEFEKIFLFSRTAKLQKDYDYFPRENIIDEFDEERLSDIWNQQTELHKTSNAKVPKNLIILDDVINDEAYKKSKVLNDIAIGGRHTGLMVILLSQDFNSIKPIIRKNIRIAISFELASKRERQKFVEQFLSIENNHVGDILYKKITGEKYQCIVISDYKRGYPLEEKVAKYAAKPRTNFKIPTNKKQVSDPYVAFDLIKFKVSKTFNPY